MNPTYVWWAPLTLAEVGLTRLLDPVELDRLERCARPADRARQLLGVAVLRLAVARLTGTDADALRIDRACEQCGAQHGRPRLLDHPVHASVSHSGLLTVVALADDPVGVDVQRACDLPTGEVTTWVAAEARLKSGLGPAAVITGLRPPVPGHHAALARGHSAPVSESDAAVLLAR